MIVILESSGGAIGVNPNNVIRIIPEGNGQYCSVSFIDQCSISIKGSIQEIVNKLNMASGLFPR